MVAREDVHDRRANGSAATGPDEAGREETLEAQLKELRGDLRGVYDSLRRVVFVEWQRLRLRAVDTYFGAVFYICLLGFAMAASVSASLLVVSGIKGGIHAWSGAEWIGDFGAGAVVIGMLLCGGLAVRAHLRHKIVREAKRALVLRAKKSAEKAGVAP